MTFNCNLFSLCYKLWNISPYADSCGCMTAAQGESKVKCAVQVQTRILNENRDKYPYHPSSTDLILIPTLGSILTLIQINPHCANEDRLHQIMSLWDEGKTLQPCVKQNVLSHF